MKKIEQLKKEAGSEFYNALVKAAKLVKEMDGMSYTLDRNRKLQVIELTRPMFREVHKGNKKLLYSVIKNIRAEADEKLKRGMDNNGTYFID